jgi:uncharacterized protein (TIGR03086 family)
MGRITHGAPGAVVQPPDAGCQRVVDASVVPDRALDDTITQLIQQGRDREAAALGFERLAPTTRGAPMDPISQLDEVLPLLNGLVAGVDESQLDRPTPCANFDIRGVLQHMIGGATMFAAAFRGEEPPSTATPDDVITAFPEAMDQLLAAVKTPGALDRTIDAPFGAVPGDVFARFVALDGLVHGWDIATASGQPYDPPADVVEAVDGFARQAIADGMRDGDTFAAAADAPAGASPLEQLVAFTGRSVA